MKVNIKNLTVKVQDKEVLKDLSLDINDGEIHVIMGPNGAGKSILSKVIMAHKDYKVISGDILLNNQSILNKSTDEIAREGVFLAFQNPISIEGVTNSEFLRSAMMANSNKHIGIYDFIKEINKELDNLSMNKDMMHRSINENFSGGERKKNEILQLKMLKPKFIILDELDSGLDVDSLLIVCKNINEYLKDNPSTSMLIITHHPKILEYLSPKYVHILENKTITKTGDLSLAFEIEKKGYKFQKYDTSSISGE